MNDLIQKDLTARDRIVSDIASNFFVEAGAGSGKTTVLVKRMVAMVEAGIDVSRICAITFTKAAAGEFYSRFQKALIERCAVETTGNARAPGELGDPTDETRKRCREALKNIDLCFMGTIDSFCNMVLSEHPAEAGVPSNARVLSDDELAALYRREYSRIQNGSYGPELQEQNRTFRRLHSKPDGVFLNTLKMLMEHRNAEFTFPTQPNGEPDDLFAAERTELHSLVRGLLAHPECAYEKNKDSAASWQALRENSEQLLDSWNESLPEIIQLLKSIGKLRLLPQFDPDVLGPCGSAFFTPHLSRNKVGWLELDPENYTALQNKLKDCQYSLTMAFIAPCVPRISEELKKEGALSFFDYMLYLRDMLKRDAAGEGRLIRHIYDRHRYFLIDEFQDTNPMQAEIFFYLTAKEPCAEWRKCIPQPGSLFIVGDPKQSIYRFRSADVASYLSVKELFRGDVGEVLYLSRNFRSTWWMNAWFNRVFRELLPENTADQSRFEPIPLPSEAPESDGCFGGVWTYACGNGKNTPPEETAPYRVLEVVRSLVHNPAQLIKGKGDDEPREIRYGDFMLITYGKGKLAQYTSLFSAYHIPFRVEGKVVFRECPALCSLVNVYKDVTMPNESRYLYSALTDPLYRLSEKELLRLREQGMVLSIFSENDKLDAAEPVRGILADLRELYFCARDMTPSALFGLLLEHEEVFRIAGTGNLEYVWFALELLRAAEAAGEILSPADGAVYLENLMEDDSAAERCVMLSRNRDCIHVANLHKVKGLEAPIVILAAQHKPRIQPEIRIEQTPDGAKGWVFSVRDAYISTSAYGEEAEAETGSLLAERDRLLYVAATRAACALIVGDLRKTGGESDDRNPWAFFAQRSDGDLFALPGASARYTPTAETRQASELYDNNAVLDLSVPGPKTGSFTLLRPSMIKTKALTASEDVFEDAEDEDVRTDRRKRDPALVGTIVHRLMEMLVSSRNTLDLDAAVREIAWDYEAEDAYYTDILKRVGSTVRNGGFPQETEVPQDILRELLSAEEVHCEVPFCYREQGGEKLWHGVMDVLYKKDGQWHIIDYKTNADPSDLDEKYQEQMKAYVAAFREMTGESADARVYHISV
ncbi:MAG: UvrD-helicase domain-containing protein [Oscillospiraceae bacterium]|nr:UvrD-helicase domain-containing protein [Oscillospiraceae bacterium]